MKRNIACISIAFILLMALFYVSFGGSPMNVWKGRGKVTMQAAEVEVESSLVVKDTTFSDWYWPDDSTWARFKGKCDTANYAYAGAGGGGACSIYVWYSDKDSATGWIGLGDTVKFDTTCKDSTWEAVFIGDTTTGDADGWAYFGDDGDWQAHKFGWDDGLGALYSEDDLMFSSGDGVTLSVDMSGSVGAILTIEADKAGAGWEAILVSGSGLDQNTDWVIHRGIYGWNGIDEFKILTVYTDTIQKMSGSNLITKSTILPNVTSSYNLGSSSYEFEHAYAETMHANKLFAPVIDTDSITDGSGCIKFTSGDIELIPPNGKKVKIDLSVATAEIGQPGSATNYLMIDANGVAYWGIGSSETTWVEPNKIDFSTKANNKGVIKGDTLYGYCIEALDGAKKHGAVGDPITGILNLKEGTNITLTPIGDTITIDASGTGSTDSIYFWFANKCSTTGWMGVGDTVKIDTMPTYADTATYADSCLFADSSYWADSCLYADSTAWADSALFADSSYWADSSLYADSTAYADSAGFGGAWLDTMDGTSPISHIAYLKEGSNITITRDTDTIEIASSGGAGDSSWKQIEVATILPVTGEDTTTIGLAGDTTNFRGVPRFFTPAEFRDRVNVKDSISAADTGMVIQIDTTTGAGDVTVRGLLIKGTAFKDADQYMIQVRDRAGTEVFRVDGTGATNMWWPYTTNHLTGTNDGGLIQWAGEQWGLDYDNDDDTCKVLFHGGRVRLYTVAADSACSLQVGTGGFFVDGFMTVDSIAGLMAEVSDSCDIVRGDIGDSCDVVRGEIGDSCDVVRAEIRDTVNVFWGDSAAVIRANISDTADVVRGQISDTADVVRGQISDTADVLRAEWPDSADIYGYNFANKMAECGGDTIYGPIFFLREGTNITITKDNDTLEIAASGTGTQDSVYVWFSDKDSVTGWQGCGDTIKIDTMPTYADSANWADSCLYADTAGYGGAWIDTVDGPTPVSGTAYFRAGSGATVDRDNDTLIIGATGGSGDSSWTLINVGTIQPFTGQDSIAIGSGDTLTVWGAAELYNPTLFEDKISVHEDIAGADTGLVIDMDSTTGHSDEALYGLIIQGTGFKDGTQSLLLCEDRTGYDLLNVEPNSFYINMLTQLVGNFRGTSDSYGIQWYGEILDLDYDGDDDTTKLHSHGGKVRQYTVAVDSGWHVKVGSGGMNAHGIFRGDSVVGFRETGSSPEYYTYFQGGDQGGNLTYTWPVNDGDAGQYLKTSDGTGTLVWDTPGGGAISDSCDQVRSEIRDTINVFWGDSAAVIRANISDTADVVRGQISDSCDQVRSEVRDTTNAWWTDTSAVLLYGNRDDTTTGSLFLGNEILSLDYDNNDDTTKIMMHGGRVRLYTVAADSACSLQVGTGGFIVDGDIDAGFADDVIKDADIDWGSGASQVDIGDVPGGISGSYSWDFGDAPTFEIVNSANPSMTKIGECGMDGTDDTWVMYSDNITAEAVYGHYAHSVTATIADDGDWDDEAVPIWVAPNAMAVTIDTIYAFVMGSATPTLTYNIEERAWGSQASAGTDIYSADQAADADGEKETSFANGSIASSAVLVFTTGTTIESGTVDYITITIFYRKDVE